MKITNTIKIQLKSHPIKNRKPLKNMLGETYEVDCNKLKDIQLNKIMEREREREVDCN